jgi:hypothetical protein
MSSLRNRMPSAGAGSCWYRLDQVRRFSRNWSQCFLSNHSGHSISPDLAAQRVGLRLALGLQAQHAPGVAVAAEDVARLARPVRRQDAAGHVVLVPAGVDDHHPAARDQAREQVVLVGGEGAVAHHLESACSRPLIGSSMTMPLRAVAGDAGHDAAGHVLAAVGQVELVGRARFGSSPHCRMPVASDERSSCRVRGRAGAPGRRRSWPGSPAVGLRAEEPARRHHVA